ncbi:transposase [Streptomyces brevispora]|uniref:transposase n=1 Tax=Streptomyces brevispora TaxID=887462 RepID=UPI002E37D0EE|nr:transposase [Streptomyces brevispora]
MPASSRGFDGGKKINGRKRHIVVGTTGLLLTVMVTAANVTDRKAGQVLPARLAERFYLLRLVWAQGGHTGPLVDFPAKILRLALTVTKRNADTSGFVVLPRRWMVERTFGWPMPSRRLARDSERWTDTAEAMVLWSMTMVMSRRLAKRRH